MKLALDGAKPNPGHYSLKELEDLDILKYTITQNVDNLQIMVGSKSALEIHGNSIETPGSVFSQPARRNRNHAARRVYHAVFSLWGSRSRL